MVHIPRRHKRKTLSIQAWVVLPGGKLERCVIDNASDGGARLSVKDASALPGFFGLAFSDAVGPSRYCQVRWRAENAVGVMYLRRPAEEQVASLRPTPRPIDRPCGPDIHCID